MLPDGIYSANRIFTSEEWLLDHTITIRNGIISDLTPTTVATTVADKHFQCLIPSFVDVQIYGTGNKLFSVYPEVDSLYKLHTYCQEGLTDHFLVAVATNTKDVFHRCIDAVRGYWTEGGKGCLGIHLEGPWISTEKRGAHTLAHIREQPSVDEVRALLDYGKDVIKVVTIAPEVCSLEVISLIKSYDIIISAGHSNATYEEAMQAFETGHITTVTHLYNAMSSFTHRAPGLVGAVLNHPTIHAAIIPDGHHVDYAALMIAKNILKQRLFCITDAVTSTDLGPYPHVLAGDKYISNNILSGSALNMKTAVHNLLTHCSIPLEEALRMCSTYPSEVVGLDHELGKVKIGYKAAIVEWPDK